MPKTLGVDEAKWDEASTAFFEAFEDQDPASCTRPVPRGAKGFVNVTIEIGGSRKDGPSTVVGVRPIAFDEASWRLRDALPGSRDRISLQGAGGSRATFSAARAKDLAQIALEDCSRR